MNFMAEKDSNRALVPLLVCCAFLASFSQSMINTALSEVSQRFGVSLSWANWLVVGYMVIAAISIMLAAFLLKRFGARRVFFVGVAAMVVGSSLALVAPTFPVLLAGRAFQAVCTGLFYPLTTSIIMAHFSEEQRGIRLALNSSAIALGLGVGPVVTGLILTYAGWSFVFIAPSVLALGLFVLGYFFMPGQPADNPPSLDVLSVILGFFGLGCLIYGLGEITYTFRSSGVVLIVGVVILALFVWRQRVSTNPLVNLAPLTHARFCGGIALVMVGMLVSYSLSVLLPLYYEGVAGVTSFVAGLFVLGPVLVNVVFTYSSGKILERWGAWPLIPGGFSLVLCGLAAVYLSAEALVVGVVIASSFVVYAGLGFITAPSKTQAIKELPPDLYSFGAVINSTAIQISGAIGSALFVGVLSANELKATDSGLSSAQALAQGFGDALLVAACIACIGLIVAVRYAWRLRKTNKR